MKTESILSWIILKTTPFFGSYCRGIVRIPHDVEETPSQTRLYNIYKCPAGHCRLEHLDGCNATMELDKSLVLSSGARLIVDKQFPIDGICVERVVPK
jgi:hypothetical protein